MEETLTNMHLSGEAVERVSHHLLALCVCILYLGLSVMPTLSLLGPTAPGGIGSGAERS